MLGRFTQPKMRFLGFDNTYLTVAKHLIKKTKNKSQLLWPVLFVFIIQSQPATNYKLILNRKCETTPLFSGIFEFWFYIFLQHTIAKRTKIYNTMYL